MPLDAMPQHLQKPEDWIGSDMDNWYQRWILKYIHGWFAYGPRSSYWWAKWREIPIVIFAVGGKGCWRVEDDTCQYAQLDLHKSLPNYGCYLSRIQYWKQWHIQLQWPFFFAFHCYFESVLNAPSKVLYFYIGAHRDADRVYWFPSAFLGMTWK